jgi:glucosyl-dolichyl phosphate glucuronosyltransferase
MTQPLLSVVVCTHDRHADLERCLAALARLEDPVDVVVVDSGPSLPADEVVARVLPAARYVCEPEPGLSRARNRGLHEASCDLVAFVDDDAAPAADWARKLVGGFADETTACVGGTCAADFAAPRPAWLSDRLLQYAGVTRFSGGSKVAERSVDYPFGANIAFRRSAVLEAGGFRETLGRIGSSLLSGEEADLVDRLLKRGLTVRIEPSARVDHRVSAERCTSRYYWRRLWWQGISRARAERSPRVAARLLVGAPIRLGLWLVTRDRVHLYRIAETAGFVRACLS